MTDPARGSLRLLRALGLLATVTGLVLGAHVAGGGVVTPVPAAAVAALIWPAALLAARRRVRLAVLLPGLAAGQVAGHALLAFFGPSTAGSTSLTVACLEHSGHLHSAAAACRAVDGHTLVAHHAGTSVVPSGSMLVAHLLATVVAAVLVARGEAIIWRLVDLVAPRRPHIVRPATVRAVVRGAVRAAVASTSVPCPTGRAPPVPA